MDEIVIKKGSAVYRPPRENVIPPTSRWTHAKCMVCRARWVIRQPFPLRNAEFADLEKWVQFAVMPCPWCRRERDTYLTMMDPNEYVRYAIARWTWWTPEDDTWGLAFFLLGLLAVVLLGLMGGGVYQWIAG